MKKQLTTSQLVLTLIVATIVGVWIGFRVGAAIPRSYQGDDAQSKALYKLDYALNIINQRYVDTLSLDTLVDLSLDALLYTLDPHSIYLDPTTLAREKEQIKGKIEGIGVLLKQRGDTACILQVLPESPASQTALRPGDRILTVNGDTVAGKDYNLDKIISKIKGPRHSPVTLTVQRYGKTAPLTMTMHRNAILTPSITHYDMLTDTIGYICINSFSHTTSREFSHSLQQLKERGMTHLVLDLRGNGGGLMEAAERIVNELLPDNRLIVYVQGAHQPREETYSTGGGLFTEGGVTVLINENSASSSEIVAGAIQDNDRGMVVGRRSFGKGLVQNQIPLPDNSAMLITTSRYYTPSGRCIQRAYDNGSTAYMLVHYLNMYSDSVRYYTPDTVPYRTRNGRIVYGGGGIMPDYPLHVEVDNDVVYYNELQKADLFSKMALREVSRRWEQLKERYPDPDSFVKNYHVSDALFEQLLRAGDAEKIKRSSACLAKYGSEMRQLLKAHMARSLYGDPTFYRLLQPIDNELPRVVRFIEGGSIVTPIQKENKMLSSNHRI